MEINKYLTLINRTKGNNRKIKWIVIHYTANNGDTAWGNCNFFNKEYRGSSAHYFVDEHSIWQCVEDEDIAWHCGTTGKYYNGCRNDISLGIELCSRKTVDGEYYFKDETVDNAISLVRDLMYKYNIDKDHVCLHWDVTRKVCPAPFVRHPELWEKFLERLGNEQMEKTIEEKIETIKKEYGFADSTIQFLQCYKFGDALIDKLYKVAIK